jgi:hypothetical protein
MSEITDMGLVIIPKSDQINADDLLAGPITITVERVTIRPGTEQPVSIHFAGDGGKPFKPCKSMARVMVHCWGPDASKYVGHSMTLYCDPKVKWGGMAVGGIRISHMTHIDRDVVMALTETKGSRKPFTVKPLVVKEAATFDKVAAGVSGLTGRIEIANDVTLQAITADPATVKQRAWLAEHRPELAERVTAAIEAALARFAPKAGMET